MHNSDATQHVVFLTSNVFHLKQTGNRIVQDGFGKRPIKKKKKEIKKRGSIKSALLRFDYTKRSSDKKETLHL